MIKVKNDLTGRTFGRLTVLEQVEDHIYPNGGRCAMWKCECNCDEHNILIVRGSALTKKYKPTRSCGCRRSEQAGELCKSRRKINEYDLSGEYGIGWTSNTNKEFYFDLEDYDKIKNYCWLETTTISGYSAVATCIDRRIIRLHEIILDKYYDHIDMNSFNNRKCNLRLATKQENARNHKLMSNNTSGFTGVSWNKQKCKWEAKVFDYGKSLHLGLFDNKEDAIRARLNGEAKYYGEFAPQRHLFEQYGIITKEEEA